LDIFLELVVINITRRGIGLINVISIKLFKKEFIDRKHDEAIDPIYNDFDSYREILYEYGGGATLIIQKIQLTFKGDLR
jgi:hypothetical protein